MKNLLCPCLVVLAVAACGASEKPAPKAVQPAPQAAPQPAPPAAATPAKGSLTKTTPSADYPLKTCVVSGHELSAMGEPVAFLCDGKEVQFCCPDCIAEFKKDPDKYLSKIPAKK